MGIDGVEEELSHALQYDTGHNHCPPSPNDPFGQVRLSPEIHNILKSIAEVSLCRSLDETVELTASLS